MAMGLQTRDFISVDDVVEAILLSIRAMEETENYNSSLPLVSFVYIKS
jgi:nucleoside-diphosphate-sugar epimerase